MGLCVCGKDHAVVTYHCMILTTNTLNANMVERYGIKCLQFMMRGVLHARVYPAGYAFCTELRRFQHRIYGNPLYVESSSEINVEIVGYS